MATVPGTRCLQESSLLYRLPQELRDDIYSFVFSSTSISRAYPTLPWGSRRRLTAHNLALLRTCRRVNEEIGDWWITQVCFIFHRLVYMLDLLDALPIAKRSLMRHVVLRNPGTFMLNTSRLPEDDPRRYQRPLGIPFSLPALFKLFSGLRLDVLELWSDGDTFGTVNSFRDLIAEGDGWRELRFFHHSPTPLFSLINTAPWIHTSAWKETLIRRDGEASDPSISLFRSTLQEEASGNFMGNSVSNLATISRLVYHPHDLEEPGTFAESLRNFFSAEDGPFWGVPRGGLLFIARRGAGIDYEVKSDSPFVLGNDLRRDFPGQTWKEIRGSGWT